MLSSEEILRLRQEHLLPTVFAYYKQPLHLVRGSMQYVWDADGRQYLDLFGGIVTISAGHCHPEIVARLTEQERTLQHTTCVYLSEPLALLARKVAELAPGQLNKCFFPNSGSEANEVAMLLAKSHKRRAEILCLRHAYHGGTSGVLAMVGQSPWRHAVPYVHGIVHVTQPNCYRCPMGLTHPACGLRCAHDVEEAILTSTSGQIAALIAEPIQGFGGFVVPPPGYFATVAAIVRKYGGLFIADEVQTGVGRTGHHWWGIEHWGVEPDIMTMAKGFGNGASIGGVICTDEVAASLSGKLHFSTFGGNPGPATQALATLEIVEREGYLQRNAELGEHLIAGLRETRQRRRLLGDVRGKGLLIGIEVVRDQETKEHGTQECLRVMELLRDKG
ncbi:MAG: aspartate aminotransferase family protein, partial [Deltaproteobacteria bacterium]|nr:aspartate aminotransferase family protein [Deltaproteobacteria bacterium]